MIWMLITFIIFLLVGSPIFYAFAFSVIVYTLTQGASMDAYAPIFYSALDSFPLIAISMFVFAGELMSGGGISKRLIAFSDVLIGKIKGHYGAITVLASTFFSAVSGSGIATVAAVGGVMIPEMKGRGYPAGYAAALTGSAGFLGIIIPPSVPMILYGFFTSTNIAMLFLAGILPGILFCLAFLIANYYYVKSFKIVSATGGETEEIGQNKEKHSESRIMRIVRNGKSAFLALIMPVFIIVGIYGGYFTATEAAVIAVFYALLLGALFYRELKWKTFLLTTKKAALTTVMIMITLVFATMFSRILTREQVPVQLSNFILSTFTSDWLILLMIILFGLVVGLVMDAITGIILTTPILYPIAVTGIGMDPVHFGIVLISTLAVGLITPPMAINIYLAAQIGKTSFKEVIKYLFPFFLISLLIVLILAYVPAISLILPNNLM